MVDADIVAHHVIDVTVLHVVGVRMLEAQIVAKLVKDCSLET